jgi:DHA2 family multidrug resistance protein-like MFS transporter
VMDGAIANVALPTIAQDLHASPAFSIWIVNGYQLAITISLLFGIAAVVIGMRALPYTPRNRHAFDWQSALMSAIMFGLGIGAIDSVGHGEAPLLYLSEAVIAVIACMLLVRRQLTAASPLLPVDLLRIPIFTLSICTSIASFCAQMLAFVALPFYLSDHFGYSGVEIGLLITPWPIAIAFAAPFAGRLVERYPAGLLGGIGLLLFAGGLGMLAFLPAHPTLDVVWRMGLSGAGFGLFQSPNNRTMIAAAPRERSGGASGMLGTARLLGQTIGAALVALLLARYPVGGTQIALLVGVGFAMSGAALSTLRLSPGGARGAEAVRVREGQRAIGE